MTVRPLHAAALVSITALAFAFTPLTSPASAAPDDATEATEAAMPAHGPNQNGCTSSPDSGVSPVFPHAYFNFHDACDWHDLCYHHHYYGGGESGRKACDDGFRSRMNDWCEDNHGWTHEASCKTVASTYYFFVREFGEDHF